jgi:protein translocase SecG subunit
LLYVLYGLFILSCIVLIASVLLQPGKADAGALFANTVSTTAFGARGTQTLLSKITIGAAACFMLTALLLSLPSLRGASSVIDRTTEQPAPAPAASPAANTSASPGGSPAASPSGSPAAQESPKASPAASKPADAKATPAASNAPEAKESPKGGK